MTLFFRLTPIAVLLFAPALNAQTAPKSPPRAAPAPAPAARSELTADTLEMVSVGDEVRVLCENNVTFTSPPNLRIVCDRLEVIATRGGEGDAALPAIERFRYLLATGNVRMVQGDREATCGRAEVFPREERVVLTEQPVLLDRSADTVITGDKLVLLRGQRRVEGENVRVIGPPIRDLGPDAERATPSPSAATAP
jgi:lipopolysaccharide export system protein LptA